MDPTTELKLCLKITDDLIQDVRDRAAVARAEAHQMMDSQGRHLLTPLIVNRTNILIALKGM